jgi:hypothetical protein
MIIKITKTVKIVITAVIFGLVVLGVMYLIVHNINHIDKNTYETNIDKVNYLNINGLNVVENPFIEEEITIPSKWNKTYEKYNEVQRRQGFNLSDYKGKKALRSVYAVKNYAGGKENVFAEVLVFDGKIIAGSVFEMTTNGFIEGIE